MLTEISNIITIGAALAAAFYCHTLATKLRKFSSAKEGIGKTINELTDALENTKRAMAEIQNENGQQAEDLKSQVLRLENQCDEMHAMVSKVINKDEARGLREKMNEHPVPNQMQETLEDDIGEMPQFRTRKTRTQQ